MAKIEIIGADLIQSGGTFAPANLTLPANAITSSDVFQGSNNFAAEKFEYGSVIPFWPMKVGDTVTAQEWPIYLAKRAATLEACGFACWTDPTGGAPAHEVNVMIVKNDSTNMLSATVDIEETTGDRTEVQGTVSVSAIAAGDSLSVDVTLTGSGGTQGLGLYGYIHIHEDSS